MNFKDETGVLNKLKCLLQSYGMAITILEDTRITATSSNCIDNIITNIAEQQFLVGVFEPCFSDHRAQYIVIDNNMNPTNTSQSVMRRCITNKGLNILKHHLATIDWSPFISGLSDIDVLASC